MLCQDALQCIKYYKERTYPTLPKNLDGIMKHWVDTVQCSPGEKIYYKKIMMTAMVLSVLFLVSYICHHLFAGESIYGDTDGIKGLSDAERATASSSRTIYLLILITHIPLAGLALPFILFAAYRALIGEYDKHKKLVRIIWPVWFYVAITGVIVYLMISPYYS